MKAPPVTEELLGAPPAKRLAVFAYGVACCVVFLATFLYALGFVGNVGTPTSLDGPAGPDGTWAWRLAVDIGLLLLFAVQHSVMARPWFKAWWTGLIPEAAERSTYVLFSSVAMIIMFAFWEPLGAVVWNVQNPVGRGVLVGLLVFGWSLVLVTTFLLNHFDLFGLRQVWLYLRDRRYTHVAFQTPWFYRVVRHPLYVGWLIGFWATPTMTAAHLVFAIGTSVYILMAIRWEERDLVELHGRKYEEYRSRVPMLIPSLAKRGA